MMHPATAPTLPCPAIWPAMPPTMAPLMHPFASAAGANAIPRMAVQRISSFIAVLRKTDAAPIRIVTIGSQMEHDVPPDTSAMQAAVGMVEIVVMSVAAPPMTWEAKLDRRGPKLF